MTAFAAAITGALPAMRAHAESLMTLTLRAYRPTGTTTTDPVTGLKVPVFDDMGLTPGKVQAASDQNKDTGTRYEMVGGVSRPIGTASWHIPISSPVPTAGPPLLGWEYVVVALGPLDDPALLNQRARVVNVPAKSKATARRLDVQEVKR